MPQYTVQFSNDTESTEEFVVTAANEAEALIKGRAAYFTEYGMIVSPKLQPKVSEAAQAS